MPKPLSPAAAEEVVYLHAPGWSPRTRTTAHPVWVLTRADAPEGSDDDYVWTLTHTVDLPVEHVALKRYLTHDDTKRVTQLIFGGMKMKQGAKPSAEQMARYQTLSYTVRVKEIMDADGVTYPVTEATLGDLPERDMQFLQAAITQLDEPVTPILIEDVHAARSRALDLEDSAARGFPLPPADEQFLALDDAQQQAAVSREQTFRPAFSVVPGQAGTR